MVVVQPQNPGGPEAAPVSPSEAPRHDTKTPQQIEGLRRKYAHCKGSVSANKSDVVEVEAFRAGRLDPQSSGYDTIQKLIAGGHSVEELQKGYSTNLRSAEYEALKAEEECIQAETDRYYADGLAPSNDDAILLIVAAERMKTKIHPKEYESLMQKYPAEHDYVARRIADGSTFDQLKQEALQRKETEADALKSQEIIEKNQKGETLTPTEYSKFLTMDQWVVREAIDIIAKRADYTTKLNLLRSLPEEKKAALERLESARAELDQARLEAARAKLNQVQATQDIPPTTLPSRRMRLGTLAGRIQQLGTGATEDQIDQIIREEVYRINARIVTEPAASNRLQEILEQDQKTRPSDEALSRAFAQMEIGMKFSSHLDAISYIMQLTDRSGIPPSEIYREISQRMEAKYLQAAIERAPLPAEIPLYPKNAEGVAEITKRGNIQDEVRNFNSGMSAGARLVKLRGVDAPVVELTGKMVGLLDSQITVLTKLKNAGAQHVPQLVGVKPAAENGKAYLFEEFVEGETFPQLSARTTQLAIDGSFTGDRELARACYELVEGVAEMHAADVTHNDLGIDKPEHVVWAYVKQPDGTVRKQIKIIDYGNARDGLSTVADLDNTFNILLKYGFGLSPMPILKGPIDTWFRDNIQNKVTDTQLLAICNRFAEGKTNPQLGYQDASALLRDITPVLQRWL